MMFSTMTYPFVSSEVDRTKSRWVAKVFLEFARPKTVHRQTHKLELWLNRSAFNPLLKPVCNRHGAVLVSSGCPSQKLLQGLFLRATCQTTVLCLSNLSVEGFSFCSNLATAIANGRPSGAPEIRVVQGALTPEQVLLLKIPMVSQKKSTGGAEKEYRKYLKAYGLNHHKIAELDALEVYFSRGIAGFCDDLLARYSTK